MKSIFSSRPFAARATRMPARLLAALTLSSVLATAAHAGALDGIVGTYSLVVDIDETGGQAWNVNFNQFFSINDQTGQAYLDTSVAMPADNWTWDTMSVFNKATGQTEQKTAVKWHSNETIGGEGTAWRSIISVYATGNLDPFMTYAYSVRNNTGATQNYTFVQGESVVPTVSGAYNLYADIAGSLTNAVAGPTNPFGTANAKIAPTVADQDGDSIDEIQVLKLSTDGGLNFTNAGVDVGAALETFVTGSGTYGVYSAMLNSSSGTPIDYWQIETKFSLTPGRDAAALSGFVELTPIPEPSTYALIMGAGTILYAMRRRSTVRLAV